MIAARPFQDLARGLGRNAFDLPVAGLAGLAVAFLAFAMPAELLGRLVVATGLPHLLAAAEPPLGFKARAMLGVVGAVAAFGLAYLLLRLLDRSGRAKARPEPETFAEIGPRLRRRDLHPDAPACRPISANRDFGEPAPPPLELDEPDRPVWLAEADADIAPPWGQEEELRPRRRDFSPEAPVRAPISAIGELGETAPPVLGRAAAPARLPDDGDQSAEAAPEPAPEPEAPSDPAERSAPAWLDVAAAEASVPDPEPKPHFEPPAEASLAELMRRLEHGLARRRTGQRFAVAPQPQAPIPQVFPEANDDRLQNAIESLQRFAARGD